MTRTRLGGSDAVYCVYQRPLPGIGVCLFLFLFLTVTVYNFIPLYKAPVHTIWQEYDLLAGIDVMS